MSQHTPNIMYVMCAIILLLAAVLWYGPSKANKPVVMTHLMDADHKKESMCSSEKTSGCTMAVQFDVS